MVRFGLAGTSHWAREVHLRALLAAPNVELVGLWGRTPEKARELAAASGIEHFASYDAMLEAVDAVSIAVPPQVQPALAVRAAAAGKSLLLEKPLAHDGVQAEAVAAAVREHGVPAIVFFMRRFVAEIEDGVGEAVKRDWESALVQVHSDAMAGQGPYAGSVWRQAPGAALWDIGPHVFSILLPVLGAVTEISAQHADRFSHITSVHESGACARTSLTLHASPGQLIREYSFMSGSERLTLPEPPFSHPLAFSRAVADLVEMHAARRTGHRCDVGFGLEISRLLAAATASAAASGEAVDTRSTRS